MKKQNMIKLCTICAFLMILLSSLNACDTVLLGHEEKSAVQVQVYEIYNQDCLTHTLAQHTSDFDLIVRQVELDGITPERITHTIGQTVLSGEYYESIVSPYYLGDGTLYAGVTEEGQDVIFGFNNETGQLISYRFPFYTEKDLTRPIYTQEECEAIARQFVSSHVDSDDEYEIEKVVYREFESYGGGCYKFHFTRMVDGMKSEEQLEVTITARGRFVYYCGRMLGSMDGQSKPEIDEAVIADAIRNKMASIYSTMTDQYEYSYEIEDLRLTRLESGQLYLRYQIKTSLIPRDGIDLPGISDYTQLLIPVD